MQFGQQLAAVTLVVVRAQQDEKTASGSGAKDGVTTAAGLSKQDRPKKTDRTSRKARGKRSQSILGYFQSSTSKLQRERSICDRAPCRHHRFERGQHESSAAATAPGL